MRTVIILLLLFIITIPPLYSSDWYRINNKIRKDFNGMFFRSNRDGYLVTENGLIVSAMADSTGWRFTLTETGCLLKNVFFLDNGRDGFAIGSGGILHKTTDSGQTWSQDTLNGNILLNDIAFLNDRIGLAIGNYTVTDKGNQGIAFKTEDGGITWHDLGLKGLNFLDIVTTPDGRIFFSENNRIFMSPDRGQHWTEIRIPTRTAPRGIAIYGNNGIALGMGGFLAVTDDGGKKWTALNIIPTAMSLFDVLMLDSLRAYAIGPKGEILFTDDGGHNWIPEASGTASDLRKISRADNRIYICGDNGTLLYKDIDD
nr:hypothetical protein [candidate division Zixibacteria bacterium]